jgi:hypothetical protein
MRESSASRPTNRLGNAGKKFRGQFAMSSERETHL